MTSYSQNTSFPGVRQQRSELTTLISKNVKTGFLKVDGPSTLNGSLTVNGTSTLNNSLTVSGISNLDAGVRIGGTTGSNLYKIYSGTVSVDPGNIGAATKGSVNVTISGLHSNDRIIFQPPTGLNAGLLYCGSDITSNNTVTIYLYNKTGGGIDDGANTWKYTYLIFYD